MPADENALSASIKVGGIVFRALNNFSQKTENISKHWTITTITSLRMFLLKIEFVFTYLRF
jgi:hypothetical protein